MKTLSVLLLCLMLASCRTNHIARYPLEHETIAYHLVISDDAAYAYSHRMDPTINPIADIFSGVGVGPNLVGHEVNERLERAINPDSLVIGVAAGIQSMIQQAFNVRMASSGKEQSRYSTNITLSQFSLHTNNYGVYARVQSSMNLVETGSDKLIWEDEETMSIPLRPLSSTAGTLSDMTTNIISVPQLLGMNDQELRTTLDRVAQEAGHAIAVQLQKDSGKK